MRFIIVGAGALGTILAAHLARAGHEVKLLARGQRADVVQREGLRLRGLLDCHQACEPLRDASALQDTDVLILTPKTYHHEQALQQVKHLKAGQVFSVANGVLKTDQIESVFGTPHTLGCMADLSGELLGSGEVLFTRNINVQIGALLPKSHRDAVIIAETIQAAGVNASAVSEIRNIEWSKFVPWVAFLALSVITRLASYRFLMDADAALIIYRITREMHQLASKLGIELIDQSPAPARSIARASADEAVAMIRELGRVMQDQAPGHRMSALQDLENHRPLELEETMGDALKRATEVNHEMPTVAMCYHLLAAINRAISKAN